MTDSTLCDIIWLKGGVKMTEQEVVALMKTSKSEEEWNANCDKVKATCGGYPDFWYSAVIMSGLLTQVKATW